MTLDMHVRAGQTAHDQLSVDISPSDAGWHFSGLRVLLLGAGESASLESGESELLVLPLEGEVSVVVESETYELQGRTSAFERITDSLYIPRGKSFTLTSATGGRFALPSSVSTRDLPVAYLPREKATTGIRGAGDCSRQVTNYALNNGVETSHLLVTEVITPGGNWSSYPAHKHDEHSENERELEEIYYFEIASSPSGTPGFGFHRTYGSSDERPIDVCAEVRDGDVALVPHGYHGPCVAAPGYDMYYLNVMAGPSEDLEWLAPDDPAHHWIRAMWDEQETDPRLPMAHY